MNGLRRYIFLYNLLLIIVFQPVYAVVSKTPVERLEEVEVIFAHHQYEDAIKGYKLLTGFDETAPEALYRIGECYYNLGEYNEAIYTFRDLIDKHESSYIAPEAIYACGMAYLARGDSERAKEYLVKKIDEFPGYSEDKRILSGKGILLYFEGRYEEAMVFFEDAVTKEGLFYKAKCLARLGKPLQALAIYKKLANSFKDENFAEYCHYGMADALFYNKDYAGAIEKYEFFIEKYPWSHLKEYSRYKLGCCYFHEGDYEASLFCYKYSTDSRDRFLAAHSIYMIGKALTETGRINEAITMFQEAKSSYPDLRVAAIANFEYGRSYIALGDTLNSLIAFNQMSSIYPTGSFAGMGDYLAGVTFLSDKRYTEAIERFQNILRYFSISEIAIPAYAMMVYSYNLMQDYNEGASVSSSFEHLIESKGGIWVGRAKLFLGELYYYMDRIAKAKTFYESVLKDYDEVVLLKAPAYVSKGWCILEEGRYNTAKDIFESAFQRYGSDTSLAIASLYGWGIASFNMGEYDEAYQVFLFGIGDEFQDSPIAGDAYYYGGKALFVTQKYANAIDYWEKVLINYPESEKAPYAAFDLAVTYKQAAEYTKAINHFRLVVNQYPESELASEAQFQLGATYFNAGDYVNAIREYDKYSILYQESPQAQTAKDQMELSYYMLGQDNPEALDILINEHSSSQYAAEAQWIRAGSAFNDENYANAVIEFRKLVTNFSESPYAEDAQYYIILSYAKLKQPMKELEEAEKFIRYFPESDKVPSAFNIMGVVYYNLGSYEDALRIFKKVLAEYPDGEEYNKAGRYIAKTYQAIGDEEKAQEYITRFGE
ncbi:tetratricopeptide repeat protein [candidate division WOR-3 bacterium]|nr:tetratricopeptide repeat protein [candidate division WOR-3 bacterium]